MSRQGVSVLDGEVNRNWNFSDAHGGRHVLTLFHDTVTGARAAMLDYEVSFRVFLVLAATIAALYCCLQSATTFIKGKHGSRHSVWGNSTSCRQECNYSAKRRFRVVRRDIPPPMMWIPNVISLKTAEIPGTESDVTDHRISISLNTWNFLWVGGVASPESRS